MHRHLLAESTTAAIAAATPMEGNNRTAAATGEAEYAQANFDTNMVIILAALLCALVVALGLNTLVRCVLRCSRQLGMETPEQAAARLSATGLKKSALRKIPIFVYGSVGSGSGSGSGLDINPGSECPICLGEFVDGEKVRVLPKCNHGFHVRCIDTWLGSHSSCPNCRHSLIDTVKGAAPPQQPPQGGGGGQEHVVVVEVGPES